MTMMIEAEGLKSVSEPRRRLTASTSRSAVGTVLGVLGPNGAGKTTAVRVLATLLRADAGCATIAGHDVVTRREPSAAPSD